jgi:hypothetical protein
VCFTSVSVVSQPQLTSRKSLRCDLCNFILVSARSLGTTALSRSHLLVPSSTHLGVLATRATASESPAERARTS